MEMKKAVFVLTSCASLMLVAGCGENKSEMVAAASTTAVPATAPSTPAPTASTQPKSEDVLTVNGPLIVEHQVDVTAQRDGVVSNILSDAGAHVKTGATLAQLDNRQLTANLDAARAKTRSVAADLKNWEAEAKVLEADYVRAQRLWNEKLIAEEQLEHAKYKAESDQWDIIRVKELLNNSKEEEHSLELEIEKTRITAPFGGVVARRYVREGQEVAKGDRLFWVSAEGPLRMRFTLPERFVGRLKKGQELPLSSADVPQERHTTRIVEISPVVDPASGTIEVLAELVGPAGSLKPGMTASVRISNPQ